MASVSQDYTESVLNDLNDLSDLGRTEHAFYIERQLIRQALLTCGGHFLLMRPVSTAERCRWQSLTMKSTIID
jgi:hypothetical protein